MNEQQQSLETLQDIKRMMERSSRFISLSGLSGISAGLCALAGAWLVVGKLVSYKAAVQQTGDAVAARAVLIHELILIATVVFIAAFVSAFFFTYLRSKKSGIAVWGTASRRLMVNVAIPMAVGAIVIYRLLQLGQYELLSSSCLIFYGLALVNASKYTLGEVRYLGYGQIILGTINLWVAGYGLIFWATGFGFLHIVYGLLMWYKYERSTSGK